jgi:hypothetical protein
LDSASVSDSLVKLRIGGYHEALGKSVLQIGTEARSMHKSQGFGAVNDHGFSNEFLQLLAGQPCAWDTPRIPSERPPLHLWRDVLADRPWFTDRDSLPLRRWEVAVNESPEPFEVYGRLLQPGERAEFEANPLETAYCTAGDRVKGELRRPVIHADPLSVHVELPALVATHDIAYRIDVTFTRWALAKDFAVEVRVPKGWKLRSPNVLKWTAAPHSDRDQRYVVVVEPGANPEPGLLEFWSDGRALRAVVELRYDHIPHTEVWTEGGIPMRYLPMNLPEATVGVIEGAGDDAAEALGQLGFAVRQLDPRTMTAQDLNGLSAVVTGIRAFNATPGMDRANALLEPWIKAGGRLVMQYTTASTDRTADQMGPIPFELGRKRVTVESVPPTVLKPKHPIWTTPNTLTAADFEGWVQERGLYFAEKWPSDYTPLIEWSDPGESATQGALITARYGQGSVTYCGLALFRQWREGVPGAYRILANLVAHEH